MQSCTGVPSQNSGALSLKKERMFNSADHIIYSTNQNVKNSEESEILCHLQDNKFTWQSLMDTGERHGAHGSGTKVYYTGPCEYCMHHHICISLPCSPKSHRGNADGPRWMPTHRVNCVTGEEVHTRILLRAVTCPRFAPERGTFSVLEGYSLYKHP